MFGIRRYAKIHTKEPGIGEDLTHSGGDLTGKEWPCYPRIAQLRSPSKETEKKLKEKKLLSLATLL